MSKLTAEDMTWLEDRLSAVSEPVNPRPEFVNRARNELMRLNIAPPRRIRSSVLVGVIFSATALIAAILLLLRQRSA